MTTHFSNGVTNVIGKSGGTSLFSGIKQPLITGGTSPQEFAYQNDFVTYNASDWQTVTSTGGSDYQLADYAFGWLRQGDANPAAGEIQGVADYETFQYSSTRQWYFETRIAVTANGKLDDFEIEAGKKNAVKGDVYLAKITRVEPSLQAAFVDFGRERHGFLSFNDIQSD